MDFTQLPTIIVFSLAVCPFVVIEFSRWKERKTTKRKTTNLPYAYVEIDDIIFDGKIVSLPKSAFHAVDDDKSMVLEKNRKAVLEAKNSSLKALCKIVKIVNKTVFLHIDEIFLNNSKNA